MSPEFCGVASDEEILDQILSRIRGHALALIANGETAMLVSKVALEPVTVKQRRFFHGVVLQQISEQARVCGQRYVIEVWKEHARKLFLPDTWVVEPAFHAEESGLVPNKRATPRRVRSSTEDLGVRAYAEHIEKVIQYATVELGVVFNFTNEEQQLRRPRHA